MKELTKDKVTFTINCLPEYEPITKALSFETTGADHSEYINKVLESKGDNEWLWCAVEVVAEFKGIRGAAYLGQCAYENEAGFKVGGYYEQMMDEAFEELKGKVNEIINALTDNKEPFYTQQSIAVIDILEDVRESIKAANLKNEISKAIIILKGQPK